MVKDTQKTLSDALNELVEPDTPRLLREMDFISIADLSTRLSMSRAATAKLVKALDVKRAVVGRRVFVSLKSLKAKLEAGGAPHARKGRKGRKVDGGRS